MADVPSLRLFKEKINQLISKDTALDKKIIDGDNALSRRIDGKLGSNDTAVRATADSYGNRIDTTYLTKEEFKKGANVLENCTYVTYRSGDNNNDDNMNLFWDYKDLVPGITGTLFLGVSWPNADRTVKVSNEALKKGYMKNSGYKISFNGVATLTLSNGAVYSFKSQN